MVKSTKIGVTIGPSCADTATIKKMITAGMNFARINFSHGTHESNGAYIVAVREAEEATHEPVPILADLQGPRIRLGDIPQAGIELTTGQTVVLASDMTVANSLPLDYPELPRYVKPRQTIFIDDGRVQLEVASSTDTTITATVVHGGIVHAHKGINLPDTELPIPVLSEKDKQDVAFVVEAGVDMIGLSFVSSAKDIVDLRYLIRDLLTKQNLPLEQAPTIIAKIERHEAVKNLDEIVEAADGIMVARGDLGLELPAEDVPLIQKHIIDIANYKSKPVIVATQLLDSMRENARPTRAEVSDVANAVIDHTDALLLTNETASGNFPVEAVETMSKVIAATERSKYDDKPLPEILKGSAGVELAVADLSRNLTEEVRAKLILAASITGETGRLISHVRPRVPIVVATHNPMVWRQLNISWGVRPFIIPQCNSIEELIERSMIYVKEHKIAKVGERMIIVAGEPVGEAGNVNLVEVKEVK